MRFQTELVPATMIRRYKRFLADVRLDNGAEVTAHCPNPGSMMGLADAGLRVWAEPNDDPKKKLKYGLRLVEVDGATICVDTSVANRFVKEALEAHHIKELPAYDTVRAEVPYGEGSRVDFLLDDHIYLEVKSVTLSRDTGLAEFPDSVTARGSKHVGELAKVVKQGYEAVLLYLVMRDDCDRFQAAGDIDPTYAAACDQAKSAGVQMLCLDTILTPKDITLGKPLQIF